MKEQLITFETTKLAKEKGFSENVREYYHPNYGLMDSKDACKLDDYNRTTWADGYCSAPTQSLLQKWLREEHGVEVWVSPFLYEGFMEDGTYN